MAARTRPLTGELGWELGDYSILRTVDSGKFGIVYWAEHKPTGRQAALKLIPLEGADSEEKVAAERHGAMLQQRFSRTHKGLDAMQAQRLERDVLGVWEVVGRP